MCGIIGFANPNQNYLLYSSHYTDKLLQMKNSLIHRGPDNSGILLSDKYCLGHTRLAIRDRFCGVQPMTRIYSGKEGTLVYNGEIYNIDELKDLLLPYNIKYETSSDTEILLYALIIFGNNIIKTLNGTFAFCYISEDKLTLARDHIGVKPLYYTFYEGTLIFSSEIKGIFSYGIVPQIDVDSLNQIITLGPAHTPGNGVFSNIVELKPGHFLDFSLSDKNATPITLSYWSLKAVEHKDDYATTVDYTRQLVEDSIHRQLVSDIPLCTFLSGGLDSSLVTAIAHSFSPDKLDTYSFDFIDNDKNFVANNFQSSLDKEYVDVMVAHLSTNHKYLFCDSKKQYDNLTATVDARDMPCMADVESSLLYFCQQVSNNHHVALTGECADEIFGGYPWFHNLDAYNSSSFPWSTDLSTRTMLLKDEIVDYLSPAEYLNNTFRSAICSTPHLDYEKGDSLKIREISWLNLTWFMQTLLSRMDRASMCYGLEARVPFADYRIIEYVYNVPWNMKAPNGIRKNLLIEIGKNYLPEKVLYRKKSPYPKTYDPMYEKMLCDHLKETISGNSSLLQLYDKNKLIRFIESKKDYGTPWYGQLMAGPQLLAYLIQIEYWLDKYHLTI